MSTLQAELEVYRARITSIQADDEEVRAVGHHLFRELPEGYFDARQTARYHRADPIIMGTSVEFLQEAGLPNFQLVREFRELRRGWVRPPGEMCYVLSDQKGYVGDGGDSVRIHYSPGGRMTPESLDTHWYIPVLVPLKVAIKNSSIDPIEAVGYLSDPQATQAKYISMCTWTIDRANVRAILTMMVSNPKLDLQSGRVKSRGAKS